MLNVSLIQLPDEHSISAGMSSLFRHDNVDRLRLAKNDSNPRSIPSAPPRTDAPVLEYVWFSQPVSPMRPARNPVP